MDKNTTKAGEEMTTEQAKAFIASVTPDMVREVYSGKQGCMCGCNGKYSVNPAHKKEADEERGYEQPSTARHMVMIKKVLGILQAHPETMIDDGYIIYVPRHVGEERNYVVYLCKSAAI